jgi:hypothetical protein
MKGYIKFFDVRKRLGYIVPNGKTRQDKDSHVFFHEAELLEGGDPRAGEIVEYSLNPNFPNAIFPNPRALECRVLSKTSYPVPIDSPQQRKAVVNGD